MVEVGIDITGLRSPVVDKGNVVNVGGGHGGDDQRRRVRLDKRRRQTGNAFLVNGRRRRRLNKLRGRTCAVRQGHRGRIRRHIQSAGGVVDGAAIAETGVVRTGSGGNRRRSHTRGRRHNVRDGGRRLKGALFEFRRGRFEEGSGGVGVIVAAATSRVGNIVVITSRIGRRGRWYGRLTSVHRDHFGITGLTTRIVLVFRGCLFLLPRGYIYSMSDAHG